MSLYVSVYPPHLPQPGGWKCRGIRLGTLRTWVTPDYLGSPESAGEAPWPSLVPALAPLVIRGESVIGGRERGGSFLVGVAPSCADPAPGSKAPTRVSWVLPVVDFHGIPAGLAFLPSWSLGQQRLSRAEPAWRRVSLQPSENIKIRSLPQEIWAPKMNEGVDRDQECLAADRRRTQALPRDFRCGAQSDVGGRRPRRSWMRAVSSALGTKLPGQTFGRGPLRPMLITAEIDYLPSVFPSLTQGRGGRI